MEVQQEQPPPYQSHDPEYLTLPSVPQSELPQSHASVQHQSDLTLPDLRSVLGDLPTKTVHPNTLPTSPALQEERGRHAHALPPPNRHRILPAPELSPISATGRSSMDSLIISPSDTASVMSIDQQSQRSTSVSLEDPDVRLAAEALSGLGKSGYNRQLNSHPHSHSHSHSLSHSLSHSTPSQSTSPANPDTQDEPLLYLIPTKHPWVGSTINGSLNAYNATKHYSPSLVRYSADLIERNIGTPLASTVSSVAKRTGVENGLRRYLNSGREQTGPRTAPAASNKRRKVMNEALHTDHAAESSPMLDSHEDLPPYRLAKPPSYREEISPHSHHRTLATTDQSQSRQSPAMRPAMTVAGLYVAMSESSLRSLRYCVKLLVTATEHVETVMNALKLLLQDMDRLRDPQSQHSDHSHSKQVEAGLLSPTYHHQPADPAEILAQRIKQHSDDIMKTLKTVVSNISTYAGGALPANARDYIKQQLLSIPVRWTKATQSTAPHDNVDDGGEAQVSNEQGEAHRSARRMIAFATEGLEMMGAVTIVIRDTLEHAERWMDTLPAFRSRSNRGDTDMMDTDDPKVVAQ